MAKPRSRLVVPRDLSCRVVRKGDPEIFFLSFTQFESGLLTSAERDVALAVANGLSNAQIAKARNTSPRTIANQVAAIMKKLGVVSRVALAARLGPADFV